MDQRNPLTQGRPQETQKQPRGWPIVLDWLRSPPHAFAAPTSAALMILGLMFVIFSVVAVLRLGWGLVYGSNQEALEAARVFLPLAAAAVGLPLIIWRLVILNRQTRTAEEKTQIDRETHFTSIFSKSVEQLGATREHKEVPEGSGTLEVLTRTVPNIEVRLGGLHSLARLAEESTRDSFKIEKMLSSYVRENSWYLRSGKRYAAQPNVMIYGFPRWIYYSSTNEDEDNRNANLNEWLDETKKKAERFRKWAEPLPETRVDVAEAISTLASIKYPQKIVIELYESLFIDQVFSSDRFSNFRFKRCSFVRCNFSVAHKDMLQLEDCTLVDCVFSIDGRAAHFRNCTIISASISKIDAGKLVLVNTKLIGCSSWSTYTDVVIDSRNSTIKNLRMHSSNLTLKANYSSLVDCDFDNTVFSPDSVIEGSYFVASTFKSADLSALTGIDAPILDQMIASPGTVHPGDFRPEAWPPYDPNYVDDDIPF